MALDGFQWVWIGLDGFGWSSVALDAFQWVWIGFERFGWIWIRAGHRFQMIVLATDFSQTIVFLRSDRRNRLLIVAY